MFSSKEQCVLATHRHVAADATLPLVPRQTINMFERRPLHLQATVTKAVLPLWSYHKLPKCSFRITRSVISILTDCTTGTAAATTALNRVATVSRPVAAPDPAMVQTIVDMGFSRARVEDTLRRVWPQPVMQLFCKFSKWQYSSVPSVRLCRAEQCAWCT